MTLDMFAILVNAIVKAMERADDVQHVLAIVFIGVILGIGVWWALSIVAASFLKSLIL